VRAPPRPSTSRTDIDPLPGEVRKVVQSTFDIRADVLDQARKLSRQR
jgi:hypothetical protein